jgi:hypothetical protein
LLSLRRRPGTFYLLLAANPYWDDLGLISMPKNCVWGCGNSADSDEDVLPVWAREHLDAKTGRKGWQTYDLMPAGHPTPRVNKRPGPVKGFAIKARKAVCSECNNGWMSDLQNRVKSILLPLIDGEASTLRPTERTLLAEWSAMTAIMQEYAGSASVPVQRRKHLYEERQPPPNTTILYIHLPDPELQCTIFTGRLIGDGILEDPELMYEALTIRCFGQMVAEA